MMTAQWSPWFDFRLIERVPAHAFSPKPSVDGGILTVDRLPTGLVPHRDRSSYQQFVHAAFTGRGRGMKGILTHMKLTDRRRLQSTMDRHHIRGDALPRELTSEQWAGLYTALSASGPATPAGRPTGSWSQRTTTTPETARGKEETMRNDKGAKKNAQTKDKPVITGEPPIVGAEKPAARLEAPIPGVDTAAEEPRQGPPPGRARLHAPAREEESAAAAVEPSPPTGVSESAEVGRPFTAAPPRRRPDLGRSGSRRYSGQQVRHSGFAAPVSVPRGSVSPTFASCGCRYLAGHTATRHRPGAPGEELVRADLARARIDPGTRARERWHHAP